jgi:DNA-binding NtrC family response regulator
MSILAHAWPGNVRELRNVIERAVIVCDGHSVTAAHLAIPAPEPPARLEVKMPIHATDPPPSFSNLKLEQAKQKALEKVERRQIEKALEVARGNRSTAAELLGISRSTLWEKLRLYGLDR